MIFGGVEIRRRLCAISANTSAANEGFAYPLPPPSPMFSSGLLFMNLMILPPTQLENRSATCSGFQRLAKRRGGGDTALAGMFGLTLHHSDSASE